MGVNNKQRRAAKQRERERARRRTGPTPPHGDRSRGPGRADAVGDLRELPPDALAFAEQQLSATWRRLSKVRAVPLPEDDALQAAANLEARITPVPLELATRPLLSALRALLDAVLAGGWSTDEVVDLLAARLDPGCAAVLRRPALGDVHTVARAFRTLSLLQRLPVSASPLRAAARPSTAATQEQSRRLATVRALLAKAESTTYDEEAEALMAKAQDLITKHALERLLDGASGGQDVDSAVVARLWLDSPYVLAKAHLVAAVADANGCRSILSEAIGLCTLVGEEADVRTVELLVTSLLVQADRAMLRHGRMVDLHGASRTRSFRQSFLVAYAGRIGERLREAAEAVVQVAATDDPRLLPVLAAHQARVQESVAQLFPGVVQRSTSISNHVGWQAGRAAADLALLDVHGQVRSG